jgi:polysaccharide pyruvyl transferase WcaK-like protein
MKIGFTGATGCVDFGDYAMLANNIHHIKNRSPESEFCIFSYNAANTHDALIANEVMDHCTIIDDALAMMGDDYGNVPNSALNAADVDTISKKWKLLFDVCSSGEVPLQLEPLVVALSECDVLLFNGGGYLNKNWLFRVYAFLIIILLARKADTRVIMLPQTYGPFAEDSLNDVTRAFQEVDKFYCRDHIYSEQVLTSLQMDRSRIDFAIDDLFLLSEPLAKTKMEVPEDALFIQLHKQMRSQIPNLVSDVAKLIASLVDEGRIKNVVFVVFHHSGDNELKIAEEIQAELLDGVRTEIWGPDWNAGNLIGGFADAKAVLCSRYHPLVIALRQSTPVVNLLAADNTGSYDYYSAKNHGICDYVSAESRHHCIKSDRSNVIEIAGEMLRAQLDSKSKESLTNLRVIEQERVTLWDYILKND